MNILETATIGSGTIPHLNNAPTHQFPDGTYTVPAKTTGRTRTGDAVVVINPEDFSVSIGVLSQAVTVGTTATALPADPLEYRRALVVHNNSSVTVFLGDSTVTTGAGFPLLAGEKIAFDIQNNPNVVVYAVVAAATADVRIMELA
jgi:hypothetical protein